MTGPLVECTSLPAAGIVAVLIAVVPLAMLAWTKVGAADARSNAADSGSSVRSKAAMAVAIAIEPMRRAGQG